MMDMYDNESKILTIGPYTWQPWDDADNWAEVPDPFIRKVGLNIRVTGI